MFGRSVCSAVRVCRFSTNAAKLAEAADSGSSTGQASSVLAGTVLKGCNVRVKGSDPVALEDSEYPDWLWKVLDKQNAINQLAKNPAMAARKARHSANRTAIKTRNQLQKLRS